ncbi:hypothetical protein Bhyg_17189, partial [Pseudolycoriella hygida]
MRESTIEENNYISSQRLYFETSTLPKNPPVSKPKNNIEDLPITSHLPKNANIEDLPITSQLPKNDSPQHKVPFPEKKEERIST